MPVSKRVSPSAEAFLPPKRSLTAMRDAVSSCRGCDLYRAATQGVFGEGPASARVVLVGEQPGDVEDRPGRPFVGPAGKVLDRALEGRRHRALAGLRDERGQALQLRTVFGSPRSTESRSRASSRRWFTTPLRPRAEDWRVEIPVTFEVVDQNQAVIVGIEID